MDTKILNKIISSTFSKTLKAHAMISLISRMGQHIKSINVLLNINRINTNVMTISIDAEKAFDKIQYLFMTKAMRKL
jgi:hypothetical protein